MTYHTTKQGGSRVSRAFGEVIGELKKVHWPSRPEAARLTGLVLVATIIAGALLGAVDFGFAELAGKIFLGR